MIGEAQKDHEVHWAKIVEIDEHRTDGENGGDDGDNYYGGFVVGGGGVEEMTTMSTHYIDGMVKELEHLRKQRDDLQARNTQLVEENRRLELQIKGYLTTLEICTTHPNKINELKGEFGERLRTLVHTHQRSSSSYDGPQFPERSPNGYR